MPIDRVVADFLRRVQRDPLLARSLRRAPAQTLDKVRGLRPQDRSLLIDMARAGAFPRLPRFTARIVEADFFQAYPLTYSVRRGGSLEVCIGSADGKDVEWKIVQVTDFSQGFQDPDGDTPPWSSSSWQSTQASKVTELAWNAEEVGYGWGPTFTTKVSAGAPLGLYALKLRSPSATPNPGPRAVYFVVRKGLSESPSPIVLHWPWSTMCAYSGAWASFKNLYDSYQPARLRRVSRDRPFFDKDTSSADKFRFTHKAPLKIWQFVSKMNKEIDSCTSFDLHEDEDPLQGCQLFISAGHDEYWSAEMRDRVEELVKAGGNAAFFSANVAWWRVRFEGPNGHIMACYKSAIDDPVGGEFPSDATGNWASTNRPENTLTGVSFKRGTMGTVAQVQVRRADPLLGDLKVGARFPENANTPFSTVETDGADYDETTLEVRGLDGSPKNFVVLATTEIANQSTSRADLGPHGRGTVGYFSRANGGSVFMGATTDWGLLLDDPAVAQITRNVIESYSKRQTPTGKDWELLLPRKFPPSHKWEKIRAVSDGIAIVAVMQGHLLLHSSGGTLLATDAENPWAAWTPTKLPTAPVGWIGGYASNLYATAIFAADNVGSSDPVWKLTVPVITSAGNWAQTGGEFPAGNCLAIGVTWGGIAFTMTRPLGSATPFLHSGLRKLGRTTPGILAMTALDGKLFGVGNDGIIYCRETSPVDLVWSPICEAPAPGGATFSLTGYLGRLYALAGPLDAPLPKEPSFKNVQPANAIDPSPAPKAQSFRAQRTLPSSPELAPSLSSAIPIVKPFERSLYWRTATSEYGSITPHMLFCQTTPAGWLSVSDLQGHTKNILTKPTVGYAIGQLEGNGYFRTTGGSSLVDVTYTRVCRVAHDMVLFYNAPTGEGWVYRFSADGTATQVGPTRNDYAYWPHIVYVHEANSSEPERVLFYDGEKVGMIGHYTPGGVFVADDWRNDFNQWDQVTATWGGRILFYDSVIGWVSWGHLDKVGHFVEDGDAPMTPGFEKIVPAGNEYVLFYKSNGDLLIGRVDAGFTVVGQTAGSALSNRRVMTSALGLLLFYEDAIGGATSVGGFDPQNGKTATEALFEYPNGSFGTAWTDVAPLGVLQ